MKLVHRQRFRKIEAIDLDRTVTPHAGRTRRFLVYEAAAGGEPTPIHA